MKYKSMVIIIIYLMVIHTASASFWTNNDSFINGLPTDQLWTDQVFWDSGGTIYSFFTDGDGIPFGYSRNDTIWSLDSTADCGIPSFASGYEFHTIFNIGDSINTISVRSGTSDTFGYTWNGSCWNSNSSLVSGLPTSGLYHRLDAFYLNEELFIIEGNDGGTFSGFVWNGTGFESDGSIVTGLGDVGTFSSPRVMYYSEEDKYILITSDQFGDYYGYDWNGSSWSSNATIVDGLVDIGTFTHNEFYEGYNDLYIYVSTDAYGNGKNSYTLSKTVTPSLIFQSLSISPTSFPQSQSTQITAWITGVTDSTSVSATILNPSSQNINIPLPSTGSDIYSAQFTQTNTPGRHYVTTITADSTPQSYNLNYPFTVTPTNTENTGSSSSSSSSTISSSTPIPTSSPTPIPTTNPLDNIIPNLPDSLTQNNPLENFFESLPTSIKQTISYIITPSLYLFDILFILLIIILLTVLVNYEVTVEETIFFTLALFIILRLIGINLTSILTGLT